MLHFEIGICVHTQKEMDEIFELFINTYPEAKAVKRKNYYYIELPMIRINFLILSNAIGCRFDRIYCSDDTTTQEKNEILFPLISAAHHIQPISQLYYYAYMKDGTIRMRVGKY